ncbi:MULTISPECIES: bifunctional diaminohydroxyphosphoribosylaminopyrimidine deaminase/5-amino-6-(5-phosphoribosylamino)uracil reductase RibD [Neisseria]|uniref:Riboflavin biosynthesis protein RibD n=1 Tax=Neisseria musculi TaxID=1815583 RepID=A0A7H1M8P0_9NEIS|nr:MULTISPECIES: bifunctional diaminohydroxyphosphoribosylaminopyrimidine deaminase/5-amino-6-(5-phosphoribosylamino)uracil reductase RibD [Neisseria]MBF0803491.1 bifunctional diaminohydroxyphosphoribosylaminopyrimidine deaminase/5-amino-6-(5-phosphoribosylamino)uracil reductase RibD [Neisseria sp. 19428wB4_WF04]QNT58005.1 riboflavin biosynthesis protein RibD [Neisseria musculi]TFU43777.1 bifunctional diaminohydroxyphosphoribosylaminopyrimidine deaminase/5-amino-6-(5-phosphoribosylamino)uracil r
MFDANDTAMMHTALALARQGRFSTSPNPRVGCVVAHGTQIVGQGFHVRAGEPHAEVHALRQAGEMARGAAAYVTLEPCSHHGRTPPCAEALIQAGVTRVVAAMSDPNPQVAGQGLARLREAGIAVQCGLLETEARALNRGFLSRIERGRPFVRLKCAASLDGKTALSDGRSQWITGPEARADVQILRAESCAVITGAGTILADNPQLNVRAFPTLRQPARVVLDSRLKTPLESRVVQDGGSPTLIATLNNQPKSLQKYTNHQHLQILRPSELNGRINLHSLLALLAERGFGEVMVEAGATLAGAFIEAGLIDEIVCYQSPKILGGQGKGLFSIKENPQMLAAQPSWKTTLLEPCGQDIKWVLQK